MAGTKNGARQKAFAEEYLRDWNGTNAAIKAGYSPATAQVTASQLLRKPMVARVIAERQRETAERTNLTIDWVLAKLRQNLDAAMSDEKPDRNAANRALELIGRHIGMWPRTATPPDRRETAAGWLAIAPSTLAEMQQLRDTLERERTLLLGSPALLLGSPAPTIIDSEQNETAPTDSETHV